MLTVQFTPFPELRTPRLLLRQMQPADAAHLLALRSSPAVMRYIPRPLAQTEADVLALIAQYNQMVADNEGVHWAITLRGQPALIGTIGFFNIRKEHLRAETGYLLHPAQQGKGLMKEALNMVTDYGFNTMRLHSIEAVIDPGNTPSARLLEKCGFVKEAHLRESAFLMGRFWDAVIYSRLTHLR
ncbi:GNAT family N-acetyltransferase [Chitinophaga alhagiae]|uniref:GNAT family N-acetyltransferase n=1 Tax=Chitinophaga alhagiae TaxID=2203219 RepID=UPI000E5ACC4D|nr:GNAT family protein [Chitinophaga alhagiae]